MNYHTPVLLNEVLEQLQVRKGARYIDCTLGDGGHTIEILKRGGLVLGIDVSASSLERAQTRLVSFGDKFLGVQGNFRHLEKIATEHNFTDVSGVIFDLGFSSSQLDEEIGLSFMQDSPLDMRMDSSLGVTASDLINALSERELARLFFEYSGERLAKPFAKAIVARRHLKRFQTTKELSDLLVDVATSGYERGRIHPATRVFQALRIAVNDELVNLEKALPQAARRLLPGGRMIVITFHSLEDRLVKEFGRGVQPRMKNVLGKPLTPSTKETTENVRARSAKMRVFEQI